MNTITKKRVKRKRPLLLKTGPYYVVRDNQVIRGFPSFYQAYRHALNRFGSEDFLVWKQGW